MLQNNRKIAVFCIINLKDQFRKRRLLVVTQNKHYMSFYLAYRLFHSLSENMRH